MLERVKSHSSATKLENNQGNSKRTGAKNEPLNKLAKATARRAQQAPDDMVTMKATEANKTHGENVAQRVVTVPELHAVAGVRAWAAHSFGPDIHMMTLLEKIEAQTAAVQRGDMSDVEAMLFGQALTLQTVFTAFTRKAEQNLATNASGMELCLRLAFKAQSQCRSTLETLAEIKNPRTATFIKQANVAGGHQQVNNGAADGVNDSRPHAKTANQPNELLTDERAKHVKAVDAGTKGKAGKRNPRVEAVGKGHGAAHSVR